MSTPNPSPAWSNISGSQHTHLSLAGLGEPGKSDHMLIGEYENLVRQMPKRSRVKHPWKVQQDMRAVGSKFFATYGDHVYLAEIEPGVHVQLRARHRQRKCRLLFPPRDVLSIFVKSLPSIDVERPPAMLRAMLFMTAEQLLKEVEPEIVRFRTKSRG